MKFVKIHLFLVFFLLAFSANLKAANQDPVEISASEALEWDRKKGTYTAKKDVVVMQGDIKINSDFLVASYAESNGMTDVSHIEAQGNVTISSPPYVAYGDSAVYNVKTGNAVLTGKALTVTTDNDVMTAEDKVEFFKDKNILVATGNPTIKHALDTIKAKKMVAYFKLDKSGKMIAERITATGGVVVSTPRETASGDKAIYYVIKKTASLIGNVKIKQGKNLLEGTRADVNLVTGMSNILGNHTADDGQRVKGVFYPIVKKEQ